MGFLSRPGYLCGVQDFLKIIRYSWSLKRLYILIGILVVAYSLLSQATPFFLKAIVDTIVDEREGVAPGASATLWWLLGGILAVNLIATFLQNIQGYFPAHLARYQQYMLALNGRSQGYHHESVLDKGLASPLLDLLNVRYILIPRPTPPYSG